jgi:hypothetical protein
MNNQHMIPELIKDLGKKLLEARKNSNERMILRERIRSIYQYCEKLLDTEKK